MTRSEFLKSIRKLVEYHRGCGIDYYPGSSDILTGLQTFTEAPGAIAEPTRPSPAQNSAGADPVPSRVASDEKEQGPVVSADAEPVLELNRQIGVCQLCTLHQNRQKDTAGHGGSSPLLLVVGDWLSVAQGVQPAQGDVFGRAEDQMLTRMVTAMGLSPLEVFVTNIIKCSVPGSFRPTGEHITTCVNYLKQQIVTLAPKIICAMGPATAQTLLATNQSLSQLRGRFHECKLPQASSIPVMPTYHPTYLLKNPEMKKAAWADLQAIQRELGRGARQPLS